MAKQEIRTILVKGKYADAIINGADADKKAKKLAAIAQESKSVLQDKTFKIEENEQSVNLKAEVTGQTAMLTARRIVTMVATDDLKANIRRGMYSGVISVDRNIKVDPAEIDKVLAILASVGIKAEDVWNVGAKAADLEKYRKDHGSDDVLGQAYTVEETYAVKFG